MKEAQFVEVKNSLLEIDYKIPINSNLLVCGFYHGKQKWNNRYVNEHIAVLKRKGYSPELYLSATVSLDP